MGYVWAYPNHLWGMCGPTHIILDLENLKGSIKFKLGYIQTCQVSHISRETHAFGPFLPQSREPCVFSRKHAKPNSLKITVFGLTTDRHDGK